MMPYWFARLLGWHSAYDSQPNRCGYYKTRDMAGVKTICYFDGSDWHTCAGYEQIVGRIVYWRSHEISRAR